jgi:hypothetical protein
MPNSLNRYAKALRGYFLGLLPVVAGAGLTEMSGSFIPLALAGSAALMLTFALVMRIAKRKSARRDWSRRRRLRAHFFPHRPPCWARELLFAGRCTTACIASHARRTHG